MERNYAARRSDILAELDGLRVEVDTERKVGYLILDILMAFWLADWSIEGGLVWGIVILGFLLAAVYNFLVCDFIAEQAEENL